VSLPDWTRAHGSPLFAARIRSTPADFDVSEELGYEFSGDGEHDYLRIEKTAANTEWLARQLAKFADVPAKDVGYSGLKDRNAITRQWFSVPRWNSPDWGGLEIEGVRILETQRHLKKLRRGAHKRNHFIIILRGENFAQHRDAMTDRLAVIKAQGVPNYFGEQRFGRAGGNVALADVWASGKRLPRHKRSIAISTARSFLFNQILDARVRDASWNTMVEGDVANLDGTGSVFDVTDPDDEIRRRCTEMDIHPTAPLAGDGSEGYPVFDQHPEWMKAFANARVDPGTRSLRLRVSDLESDLDDDSMTLRFSLGRGAYATAVLREMVIVSFGKSENS